jgi:hypothetical protein
MSNYSKGATILLAFVLLVFLAGLFFQINGYFTGDSYGKAFTGNVVAGIVGNGFALFVAITAIDWLNSRRTHEETTHVRNRTYQDIVSCTNKILSELVNYFPVEFSDRAVANEFISLLAPGIVRRPDFPAIIRRGNELAKDMLIGNLRADIENVTNIIERTDRSATDTTTKQLLILLNDLRPECDRIINVLCPRLQDIASEREIRDRLFDFEFQLSLLFRSLPYLQDDQFAEARSKVASSMRHLCPTIMFNILGVYSVLDRHWIETSDSEVERNQEQKSG